MVKRVNSNNENTPQLQCVESKFSSHIIQNCSYDNINAATPLSDVFSQNQLKQYLIPYSLPATLKLYNVDGDCDLRDFVTEALKHVSDEFKRGCTYYEFTNKLENILEGKKVLLQEKQNTNKWFQLVPPEEVAAGRLKLYGEGVARSSFGDRYRVFVQSFGSGARHLPRGSWILYFNSDNQVAIDLVISS